MSQNWRQMHSVIPSGVYIVISFDGWIVCLKQVVGLINCYRITCHLLKKQIHHQSLCFSDTMAWTIGTFKHFKLLEETRWQRMTNSRIFIWEKNKLFSLSCQISVYVKLQMLHGSQRGARGRWTLQTDHLYTKVTLSNGIRWEESQETGIRRDLCVPLVLLYTTVCTSPVDRKKRHKDWKYKEEQ